MKKYLTKEVRIALTGIIAIILLFYGINFLKGINIFKSSNTYYVAFNNIGGLTVSSPVFANGYPVGIVRTISYDYNRTDRVIVGIELDNEMRVPVGTHAELENELMGGVKMSLILGANLTKNLEPEDTLTGAIRHGAMAQLEQALPTIMNMVPKLDSILTNLNTLTAAPALAQTLSNTAELTHDLKQTAARLNSMMHNDMPRLMSKFNRIGTNMETLTDNLARIDVDGTMKQVGTALDGVNQLSTNLNATTNLLNTQLNSRDNTLGLFLNDRGVYDNLNNTLRNADSLMIDLRLNPKRYVHFSIFGRKNK